jgi:uncharacterized repeat protein (TIGR04138 family)
MEPCNFAETLDRIILEDSRYDREAYAFVRGGLDFTLKMLRKKGDVGHRHVSGQELLEGLRRFSLEQFGPMSKTVLNYWGIQRCEDFADLVFNMVSKGILGKTDPDSKADFTGGYDFEDAFVKPFLPPVRTAARPRSGSIEPPTAESRRRTLDADPKKLSSGPN